MSLTVRPAKIATVNRNPVQKGFNPHTVLEANLGTFQRKDSQFGWTVTAKIKEHYKESKMASHNIFLMHSFRTLV